jgi:transposase
MRPPCLLPPSAEKKLTRQLDQAATKTEYRRVLCVWLRAVLGMPAAEIATALGWSVGTVHNLHSQYLREGDSALAVCERGGRHRELLTVAEEGKLLATFASIAAQGEITEVSAVRAALEQQVGQAVAKSTVYRLLERQGWRKLAP